MTPPEVRAARQALGLTQGEAARLFGVEARTWRSWESVGSRPRAIPPPAVLLLRACGEVRGLVAWLEKISLTR